MSDNSTIHWTDATWNPTTGCDQVSPGCDNCYALTLAGRLKRMGNARYQVDGSPKTSGPGFGLTLHEDVLGLPLKWKKPRRVFVNSMSDLFHDDVPAPFIARAFNVMGMASQHVFQVLTKRPRRMQAHMTAYYQALNMEPLPNVWLGTSVEDQKRADLRIPLLLETPAAVRFLSCEPLLGPIDLRPFCNDDFMGGDLEDFLHWVIVGGESGPGRREMDAEWVRSLRDFSTRRGISFFYKQGSGPRPGMHREIDGRTWDEFPATPPTTKELEG